MSQFRGRTRTLTCFYHRILTRLTYALKKGRMRGNEPLSSVTPLSILLSNYKSFWECSISLQKTCITFQMRKYGKAGKNGLITLKQKVSRDKNINVR